jgi:ADP-ribosylglycohydrolase
MRVSPIGWYCNSIDEALSEAKKSAEVTHNHPEGIKGAQATAVAIYMARTGKSKNEIKDFIVNTFNYDLNRSLDVIRPHYKFDVSCQGSVPEAIIAFLESTDFENAIRLSISIGGDSDTIACITGGIAEAFYQNIPDEIIENVLKILPKKLVNIIESFSNKYRNLEI